MSAHFIFGVYFVKRGRDEGLNEQFAMHILGAGVSRKCRVFFPFDAVCAGSKIPMAALGKLGCLQNKKKKF